MSASPIELPVVGAFAADLAHALEVVASTAEERDRDPRFPSEGFTALTAVGVPQLAGEREHCDLAREVGLVRSLAAVDASCARILDGHFNGVERVALCAGSPLRDLELEGVRTGELLLGVWGADPAPGEGPPAMIERDSEGELVLRGIKTFCSGAGGIQRALVVARNDAGARRLAYVDVTHSVRIDRRWYRASGLRSSESHRVEFQGASVLAVLGEQDELMREPWFARDAIRTAATWAGIADGILEATLTAVADKDLDAVGLHTLGQMRLARSTIDRWLDHTVTQLNAAGESTSSDDVLLSSVECRLALAEAARVVSAQATRIAGSRALVGGGKLDRLRRDLDLFLLQHRLDPKLVELGEHTLREFSL